MMKKTYIFGLILFLGVFLLSGCGNERNGLDGDLVTTGTLEANEVDVSSKIPGRIEIINAEEGGQVEAGQVIIKLEKKDVAAKLHQVEAQVKGAEAQLAASVNGELNQKIAQAKAAYDLYQKKYDRIKGLFDAGAVSQDDMDGMETQLIKAKNDYEIAKNALPAKVQGLQAQLELAQAGLEEAQISYDELEIKAPISGSVSSLIAQEQEIIGSGMSILTITDYKDMWVETNVDEDRIGEVFLGQKAEVKTKAYPETLNGEVISINANPDFAIKKSTNEATEKDTISYLVKIKLEETEKNIYPGMLVDVSFGVDQK